MKSKTNGAQPPKPDGQPSLDLFADVVCTLDQKGCFLYVNSASKMLWGYEPAELRGRCFEDFLGGEEGLRTRHAFELATKAGQCRDVLNHFRCKDGRLRPSIWSVEWQDGVFYGIVRDGSLRQAYEKDRLLNEQRLYRAYQLAGLGWWEWNAASGVTLSEELCGLFGWDYKQPPASIREAYFSLVHPDDRAAVADSWREMMERPGYSFGHRILRSLGETAYVAHQVQVVRDAAGTIIELYGTTRDVTREKQAEEALSQSQRGLEQIVESLGDGFYALDNNWRITYWNRKIEQITGVGRQEVLGRNIFELYPHSRQLKIAAEFQRAVREQRSVHFEESAPTHGLWLDIHAYPSEQGGLYVLIKDQTERQKEQQQRRLLDEQLRAANESLQRVLDSMSDGFFVLNRAWIITYANDRVAGMLGLQKEEMVGRNLWEWLPQSVHTQFYTGYHRAFAENTLVSVEDFLPHFNKWFEANAYPSGDELAVFVRNIDERKQRERELQISNERFQFVSMATSDVIWDRNLETGALYINQSFTKVFGHELPEGGASSRLWTDNLHPGDRDRVISSQAAALQDQHVLHWEDRYRFQKKDGETAYVTDRAVILRDGAGRALRMVGSVQDITGHRRQERRLEFIARATSEVIWERQLDSPLLQINAEKYRQLFGYTIAGTTIDRSLWLDKIHPEDAAVVEEKIRYALAHQSDFFVSEYRFRRQDGSWAFVKDRCYIVRDEENQPVSLIGAMEDISRERAAEQALQQSEQRYKQLFDQDPLPKAVYDLQTLRILDVNRTAIAHYGYSHEEFTAMTIWDIRPGEEYPKVARVLSRLEIEGTKNFGLFVHQKKNGERIQVEVSVTTIRYQGRKANLASMNDVTEKIKLQQALIAQEISHQRNITKATLEAQEKERSEIGRELHDGINQVLTSAKLYVENIRYYPAQGDAFIDKSVALLSQSIEEIRRLSRALVSPTIKDMGFRDTVLELAEAYRDLRLFEVVCSFRFSEKYLSGELALTLYRILQEAFHNTVKYAGASLVEVCLERRGDQLHLTYRDNGKGFSPSAPPKGIGLKNIQNRADAYQGRVSIRSARGKGFELRVRFPLPGTALH